MQYSPQLCRLVSTSQWRSLSLYLSLRHSYTSRAGSYAKDKTDSTTKKTSNLKNRAGIASAKKPGYLQGNDTSPIITYYNEKLAKRHAYKKKKKKDKNKNNKNNTNNTNTPRGISRRAGNHDNQARKGVKRDDNGGDKRGTGTENRTTPTITLYNKRTSNRIATVLRRFEPEGTGGSTDEAKNKKEEHDLYRPLRRRSGAGDIRSQMKAELDSSRDKISRRASGGSSRSESKSLLDEVFPSDESKAQAESKNGNGPLEMPRLTLEHLIKDEEYKVPTKEQSEEERLRMFYKAEREHLGKEKGILLFRGLSPSMEDEDFRRLSPKGKHIEGWEHELGNIVKGML